MSLFSFLRKNKQESASDDGAFYSRAEEESKAVRGRTRRRSAQADPATDPVLPEKKRARRRLIGAVALVLAAVIGLPMILDSEPKPLADDVVIQIPSKEKAAPMESAAPALAQQDASLDAKEEMIEPPAAETKPAPEATKAAQEVAAPPAQTNANDAAKPETAPAKTADKAQPAPAKTESKAVDRSEDAARALALLEGKPDPKSADKKAGKFVIQVAALATQEKVDELQAKLKQGGISSYTQKIATASGTRTRIRVGPFASKDEAEKVRARIVKLGLNGTVVPA